MDLLRGYGSSDEGDDVPSSEDEREEAEAAPSGGGGVNGKFDPPSGAAASATMGTAPALARSVGGAGGSSKNTRRRAGGKRILSLGAVLPPEIWDRLTRRGAWSGEGGAGEGDSDSSSEFGNGEGDGSNRDVRGGGVKRKRRRDDECGGRREGEGTGSGSRLGGDRSDMNSLLKELQSAPPAEVSESVRGVVATRGQRLGDDKDGKDGANGRKGGDKLGFAFMNYTSSTTKVKNEESHDTVEIHATRTANSLLKAASSSTLAVKAAAIGEGSGGRGGDHDDDKVQNDCNDRIEKRQAISAVPLMTLTRMSAAVPLPTAGRPSRRPPQSPDDAAVERRLPVSSHAPSAPAPSRQGQSRRQRREEERTLRAGLVFRDETASSAVGPASATVLHQPSPTEFAPTAHAAVVASRAATHRASGGGGTAVRGVAMYDPSAGADVRGVGVTAKHRSKHQIHQLMASAISLEAHRAADAELSRSAGGGGGGGGRADAKRKYGW